MCDLNTCKDNCTVVFQPVSSAVAEQAQMERRIVEIGIAL